MWIKEPKTKLERSHFDNANFLYNERNIYIMDNHLSAGWCWLQKIDPKKPNSILHIDRHSDLAPAKVNSIKLAITDKKIDLQKTTFDEYLNLRQFGANNDSWPLFRWDNYITTLEAIYPNIYNKKYFAIHEDSSNIDFEIEKIMFWEIIKELDYWIKNDPDKSWIINLDVDYFYLNYNDKVIRVLSDEYIIAIAQVIKSVLDRISVLTICLSPECCGSWENSIRVTQIICNELEIDFETDLFKLTTI